MRVRTLSSPNELKAFTSSIRWAILTVAMSKPDKMWLPWQLAEIVRIPQSNIYHHLEILTELGFLTSRVINVIGRPERVYKAAQHRIEFHLGCD
jgi:predicted ArsR family transcriptional regulator